MTLVKCRSCLDKYEKTDMECEELVSKSGTKKLYFHKGECWDKYLSHKEFKRQESIELDHLNEILKQLHAVEIVPTQFFVFIQKIRNGEEFKIGNKVKKYKEGFSYKLMADTYLFCKDSIRWAKENRKFDGTMAEMKYCLAIIVDKIQVVKKRQEKLAIKKQIESEKNAVNTFVQEDEEREVVYKKKQDKRDISRFLD